jgi:hypothetical protein
MNSKFNYFLFDIFSKRIGFFFNNQEKIGSFFGLLLSFIYFIVSIVIFVNYLILTIRRNEVKVYDTSIHTQKMPSITIDSNSLYFAFGVEDPINSLRYIDETIYYPQILFIDRIKADGRFITLTKKSLEYERCKEENFGKDYQHLFISGELNNSYCLKDFNYNLTFAGGYKYEKMTYIRIKIFPCVNKTENNNHCKPREIIDSHLTAGYFSILIKNFGLNPSNFSFPILPTLQDIYTTIDKRILRNIIINFGVTEIHTDISILNENVKKVKYLQYRDNFQNFQFREEEDYLDGKEFCVTQLKLDDTIIIQKRTYTKLSEVFSQVGGYMQLMNTVFSLLALIINKYRNEVKILNSIFNFNIKEKKMSLKFRSLEPDSISHLTSNKNLIFSSKKSLRNFNNIEFDYNKSKNKLNLVDNNNCSRISSVLNISENKNVINDNLSRGKISRNTNNAKNIEFFMRSIKSNESFPKLNFNINSKDLKNSTVVVFKENININLFDILCNAKNSKKKLDIELFKLGDSFYRKRMDIVHVFTLLLITEKVLITNDDRSNLLSLNLHK